MLNDTGRPTQEVESSMLLATDLGFDSLDLAQTIVLLERSLGIDPFRAASGLQTTIRTVGDLTSVYTKALSQD